MGCQGFRSELKFQSARKGLGWHERGFRVLGRVANPPLQSGAVMIYLTAFAGMTRPALPMLNGGAPSACPQCPVLMYLFTVIHPLNSGMTHVAISF